MTLSWAIAGFVFLIIVLSSLRTRLVYEISGTSLLLFGSTRPGLLIYSLFFLPGTIIHELSHWLVAEILQVRTGEIKIFPDLEKSGNRQMLGSVATSKTDPFRGFLIGIAPFLSGLGIILVLGRLLITEWSSFSFWKIALIVYGIIVMGNSMMTSKEDRRTWPGIIVITILLYIVLDNLGLKITFSGESWLKDSFTSLNLVLGVTTGLNLVMIGGSLSLRKLAEHMTKKRVVRK